MCMYLASYVSDACVVIVITEELSCLDKIRGRLLHMAFDCTENSPPFFSFLHDVGLRKLPHLLVPRPGKTSPKKIS